MGTLAAGIKEIFATAKTTGSNVMLCGNDGTPDGHMTMANLASVLGVPACTSGVSDANTAYAKDDGSSPGKIALFTTAGNGTNFPSEIFGTTAGAILSYTRFGYSEYVVTQIYTSEYITGGTMTTWIRRGRFAKTATGSETFGPWSRCDGFGAGDLSSLASALTGNANMFGTKANIKDNINVNTYRGLFAACNRLTNWSGTKPVGLESSQTAAYMTTVVSATNVVQQTLYIESGDKYERAFSEGQTPPAWKSLSSILGGVGLLIQSSYPSDLHTELTTEGTYFASGDIVHVFSTGSRIGQMIFQINSNKLIGIHFRTSMDGGTNWDSWYALKVR